MDVSLDLKVVAVAADGQSSLRGSTILPPRISAANKELLLAGTERSRGASSALATHSCFK